MKAKTDRTYCYGMNCPKSEECFRYAGNYEFEKDTNYSFVYGIVGEWKCIERKE